MEDPGSWFSGGNAQKYLPLIFEYRNESVCQKSP